MITALIVIYWILTASCAASAAFLMLSGAKLVAEGSGTLGDNLDVFFCVFILCLLATLFYFTAVNL